MIARRKEEKKGEREGGTEKRDREAGSWKWKGDRERSRTENTI